MTRVSAIVPTFNAGRFLPAAIASILGQSRPPDEVIIVDDGSTDGTEQLARGFGPTVRYLTTDNIGPSATRNHGIMAATGDYVSFLDADDLWTPGKQAAQLAALDGSSARCCIGRVQLLWDRPDSAAADFFRDHPRGQPIPGYATISLMAERSLFEEVGYLDPSLWFADALDWFLRAEERGCRPIVLDETLVLHRVHDANMTVRNRQASIDEHARILRRRITAGRAVAR